MPIDPRWALHRSPKHSFSKVQRGELDELIGVSYRARVRGYLQECGCPS